MLRSGVVMKIFQYINYFCWFLLVFYGFDNIFVKFCPNKLILGAFRMVFIALQIPVLTGPCGPVFMRSFVVLVICSPLIFWSFPVLVQ